MSKNCDISSAVRRRYRRLAELCRKAASKIDSPTVRQSLAELADTYDRRSDGPTADLLLAAAPSAPVEQARVDRRRPLFSFATPRRRSGLKAHVTIHGSD